MRASKPWVIPPSRKLQPMTGKTDSFSHSFPDSYSVPHPNCRVLKVLESDDRIPYVSKYGRDDDGNEVLYNFWKDSKVSIFPMK
jgi:hypothetical protein